MNKKARILLCLTFVFLAGIGLGAVGTLVGVRSFAIRRFQDGPDGTRKVVLGLLQRDLGLSDEQLKGIEPTAVAFQTRLLEIRSRNEPELLELFAKTRGELRPLLSDEQLGKLSGRMEELKERWAKDEAWRRGGK